MWWRRLPAFLRRALIDGVLGQPSPSAYRVYVALMLSVTALFLFFISPSSTLPPFFSDPNATPELKWSKPQRCVIADRAGASALVRRCEIHDIDAMHSYVFTLQSYLRSQSGDVPDQPPPFVQAMQQSIALWHERAVCQSAGVDLPQRYALAQAVAQGMSDCPVQYRWFGTAPLLLLLGFWPGIVLSTALALLAMIGVIRHLRTLSRTRRAYRFLYGSSHSDD